MKDIKTKERFLELRAQDKSLRTIERELGINRRTLAKWESHYKEDVEKLKAVELEALREKHWLTEQARIERLGGQLKRVAQELETRALSDVATPKLVDMELKLDAALSEDDHRLALKTPGELSEAPQVNFALSPEYTEFRQEVMRVLESYPDVRE